MTDLNELADRVERAEGPDRELDCLIWIASAGLVAEWQGDCLVAGTEGVIGYIDPGTYRRNFSTSRSTTGPNAIPAYTSSIDAAMTLVPDGQDWYVTAIRPLKGTFAGAVYRGIHPKIDYAEAATPALALTAAALRARAATPVQVNEVVG